MATTWDPFREMDHLLNSIAGSGRAAATMPMDLFREGDTYTMCLDLPGIDPASLDVSVEDRTLTIRAERSTDRRDAEWLVRERPTGAVARQLTIGRGLATDRIDATYTDGVLTLTIPVSEEAKPRRIEIGHNTSSARPAIEQATV